MIRVFLKYFLFFCYIFNISFIFLPQTLSTRILIGFIGVIYCAFQKIGRGHIRRGSVKIIVSVLAIIIPSILTTLINDYFDPRFFGYVFQNLFYMFGAYFLVDYYKLKFIEIFKIIVICVFAHNVISLFMFFSPVLQNFIIQLQWLQNNDVIKKVADFQSRFIGIGWGNFFFGGVICSLALILNAYLIVFKDKKIFFLFTYIFISLTGMFIARITILGLGLSFIYLITIYVKKGIGVLFKIVFCFIIFIVLLTIYFRFNEAAFLNNGAFAHAFELVINLFQKKSLTTDSTDVVKEMMRFPTDTRGLLIGDGIFNLPNGSYYQETDVGYSRLMFYFGIIGTVIYFICHFTILKITNRWNFKALNFFLLLLLIISNLKGLVDLNWFMFLFYFSIINKNYIQREDFTNNR